MSTTTLSVGCRGDGIKVPVPNCKGNTISHTVYTPAPYLLPSEKLVETIASLAPQLLGMNRVTVGMLGMIRHEVAVITPHCITKGSPQSRMLPGLVEAWGRFGIDITASRALGTPSLVPSDVEVTGASVVTDHGLEVVVILGTGLGNAVSNDEVLASHMGASQGLTRWRLAYDGYIDEHERLRLSGAHWSRRVCRVVGTLRPMYLRDYLHLNGGSSWRTTAAQLTKIDNNAVAVFNEADVAGGVRCWDMARP